MNRLLLLLLFVTPLFGASQSLRHKVKCDTVVDYLKNDGPYDFVLEGTKQGFFWDTIGVHTHFHDIRFRVKNNTGEIILVTRAGKEDHTISFMPKGILGVIYPDSFLVLSPFSQKREGPFTSYLRITYKKGNEGKVCEIPTWGYYKTEDYTPTPDTVKEKVVFPSGAKKSDPPKTKTSQPSPKVTIKEPIDPREPREPRIHLPEPQPTALPEEATEKTFQITFSKGLGLVTKDCRLVIKKKNITDTLYTIVNSEGVDCFQIDAMPSEVLSATVLHANQEYNIKIYFNRTYANNPYINLRLSEPGEKHYYSGIHVMVNKQLKNYYFIQSDVSNYKAIAQLKVDMGYQDFGFENSSNSISFFNEEQVNEFKAALTARGIKATLETGTERQPVGYEMVDGKVVPLVKAHIAFNENVSDKRIEDAFSKNGIADYVYVGQQPSEVDLYGKLKVYHISIRSNLYDEYVKILDALWGMKEVAAIEQIMIPGVD